METEYTSHQVLHCHQFNHRRIDLMTSVKYFCNNFESMSSNNKKDMHLYSQKVSKRFLEATKNYIKNSESFSGSMLQ